MRRILDLVWIAGIITGCFALCCYWGMDESWFRWAESNPVQTEHLEAKFAPIAALFSGLAAGFTVFAIIKQGIQFREQQFESNFFSLLSIHRENRRSICCVPLKPKRAKARDSIDRDKDAVVDNQDQNDILCCMAASKKDAESLKVYDAEAFHCMYNLLETIWIRACGREEFSAYELDQRTTNIFQEQLGQLQNEDGSFSTRGPRLFARCYSIFRDSTNHCLYSYFRHLYHLIKYTNTNAPVTRKKNYMGIIRAQLSPYEYLMFYYHVIAFQRIERNEEPSKFKYYVELNCLLHNLQKDLLFDAGKAGEYSERAFKHLGAIINRRRKVVVKNMRKWLQHPSVAYSEWLNEKIKESGTLYK